MEEINDNLSKYSINNDNYIESIILIQKEWKKYYTRKIYKKIFKVFKKYKYDFLKNPKTGRITEYEKAAGFTEKNRYGSKSFSNKFGYFIEDIYDTSIYFNKVKNNCIDGKNFNTYFESKNRHDTMKQSMAVKEIEIKLKMSLKDNKKFTLLILNDYKFQNRNIPLHKGIGMKNIQLIDGYDERKFRWISGDEVYKSIFKENWKDVKIFIINLLYCLKQS